MDLKRGVVAAMLVMGVGGPAWAQQEPARAQPDVDPTRLGIDVTRIQKQLHQGASRQAGSGLNLKYYIDVYGSAPRLQLFARREDAVTGQVPYGEPTHREMLDQMTPQEYRAPAMDFGALMRWLADRSKSR